MMSRLPVKNNACVTQRLCLWSLIVLAVVCGDVGWTHDEAGLLRVTATAFEASLDIRETLPIQPLRSVGRAAEAYFSPDSKRLIFYAKSADSDAFHVHTVNIDGSDLQRLNDKGHDACSYFFPNNRRIVFTSTMDHPNLPRGNWSDANNYPTGAEIYTADLDGSNVKRLTHNRQYDAEVSVSPDGQWILFTRQIDGKLDLWRIRPDGSEETQITHSPQLQEGGAFYMPDSETIVFRGWTIENQDKFGSPMDLYTVKHDGTALTRLTDDGATNWAPYPAPDNRHIVFAKMLPPYNFEIFLMDIHSGEQKRLTFNDAFDGFPSIAPDGKTLSFSSSRGAQRGERKLSIYLMDVSTLQVQRGNDRQRSPFAALGLAKK